MPDNPPLGPGISVELIPIEDLLLDPNNLRTHPEYNASLVSRSLRELGAIRSVAVDGNNKLIAGNQTTESAISEGFKKALVIDSEGDVLIVHRRGNLSEQQRLMAAFLDNHASDTSMFDDARVGQAIFNFPDAFNFLGKAERDAYLLAAGSEAGRQELKEDQEGKIDLAPELADKWGIAPGQVWGIPSLTVPGGEHLLLLGDSRDPGQVANLFAAGNNAPLRMLAFDPPYGVDYASKTRMLNKLDLNKDRSHRTRLETQIQGDKMTYSEVEEFIRGIMIVWGMGCAPGASIYITGPSGNLIGAFISSFENSPFYFHQTLIWVKNNHVLGSQDYHYRHEHVFYGRMHNGPHYWCGSRSLDSVIEIDMPRSSKLHPTMKPVALFEFFIKNSSRVGEIIGDPTAGSGTTLVAAEQTARLSYLGELCDPTPDPESGEIIYGYGGVILERALDLGLTPRLLRGARRETEESEESS